MDTCDDSCSCAGTGSSWGLWLGWDSCAGRFASSSPAGNRASPTLLLALVSSKSKAALSAAWVPVKAALVTAS